MTNIAAGRAFTTGAAEFDEFFKEARELHAEAQRGEADERASHASLIAALGLEPQTTALMAVNEAGQRARKILDTGVLLHLDILPVTKVLTKKESASANLSLDGKDFIKAVEDSTRSSLALSRRVGAVAARAEALEKRRVDLRAQAPVAFRAERQERRDAILRELDAARDVLAETVALGNRYAGLAAKFVLDLAQVLETGADAYPEAQSPIDPTKPAPPASSAPTPGGKKAGGNGAGKRPPAVGGPKAGPPASKPATPTPPPAAKKPKGGDDFEP